VYIDLDSGVREKLSTIIADSGSATFLYSLEKNTVPSCYDPSHSFNGTDFSTTSGQVVQNWMIISAPRHPVLARALQNVVVSVRDLYLRRKYLGR
jgi:hypothetical protein